MGKKRAQSSEGSQEPSAKKLKKLAKKEKKEAKKLKKQLKKLKKSRKSSSSSASSASSAPATLPGTSAAQAKTPIVAEASRESVGLRLLGEMYALGKPDSTLKWEYPLRDELRRCFVGLLHTDISQSTLKRLFETVLDGAFWDQPKRPKTGELLPRKTDWMVGERCRCSYRYGGVEVDPSAFPPWMEEVMEVCMPLCGLRGRARWPNCCNLNLYDDGNMSVGWHADDEELFQGKTSDCPIISFSLGQARTFELKTNEGEAPAQRFDLRSGDLLTMEGLIQKHYQHRLPSQRNGSVGPRINLTWRWIKQHQPRCPLSR